MQECNLQINDLNLISTYISKLYAVIGKNVCEKLDISTNWLSLFTSNSLRIRRVLNDEIRSLGITLEQWRDLQNLRKLRNRLMHPSTTIQNIKSLVEERWQEKSEYGALRCLIRIVEENEDVGKRNFSGGKPAGSSYHAGSKEETNWRDARSSPYLSFRSRRSLHSKLPALREPGDASDLKSEPGDEAPPPPEPTSSLRTGPSLDPQREEEARRETDPPAETESKQETKSSSSESLSISSGCSASSSASSRRRKPPRQRSRSF